MENKKGEDAMVYVDQSAYGLRLNIIEGEELDLEQFNLLASESIETPLVRIQASIIGASHLIRYKIGDGFFLNEVFACIDVATDNRRAYYGPLKNIQGIVDLRFPSEAVGAAMARYKFQSHLIKWGKAGEEAAGVLETMAREAKSKSAQRRLLTHGVHDVGLIFQFPQESQPYPPKTIVWVRLDEGRSMIKVETLHSYPNEGNLVFTNTELFYSLRKKGE